MKVALPKTDKSKRQMKQFMPHGFQLRELRGKMRNCWKPPNVDLENSSCCCFAFFLSLHHTLSIANEFDLHWSS